MNAVDRRTIWAWIVLPEEQISAHVRKTINDFLGGHPEVRIAIGSPPERGLDGFQRNHDPAQMARSVASQVTSGGSPQITDATDPYVGLAAILLKHQRNAQRWIRNILGKYAEPYAANQEIRETTPAFCSCRGNFSQTAQTLGIHRNTVKRRVERFESNRISHRPESAISELMLA